MIRMTVKPTFDIHRWTRKKLTYFWGEAQREVEIMGINLHKFMITYIATHKKRGQSPHADGTISLEKSIKIERIDGVGQAKWGFGIGNISILRKVSPHFYVLNYGCTIFGEKYIPNYGDYIPGSFGAGFGQPPYAEKRGVGKETFYHGVGNWGIKAKTPITPINYIESSKLKLNSEVLKMLTKLKSSK